MELLPVALLAGGLLSFLICVHIRARQQRARMSEQERRKHDQEVQVDMSTW